MSKKVFKNSAYYMIASFLPTIVGFLMLPVYTRYLTPQDYGVVALVLSLQSFLPLVMTLQIHNSISRFYFDYRDDNIELKTFITTIFVVIMILSSIVVFLLNFFINDIIKLLFPKTIGYNDLFLLSIYTAFFNVFTRMFVNLIRVQQKAKLFMRISLMLFFISLMINIYEIIILQKGAYGVIEATLYSVIVSFFVYLYMIKQFFIFSIDFKLIRDPLKFSLPLIPHSLSGLIFMYSDRIVLERYVTLSAIGLYMFSDKIANIFKMVVNEFNRAFSPYFNETSKYSKKEAISNTQQISLNFIYMISILVIIVSLFSTEIVYYLFDEKYFDTWMMIPLLSSAYIFRSLYCFSSSGLFYEKQTGKVAMITILAGILNIIINIIFIPKYGVMVAIYSTIFSFFITFVMAEIMSYKVYYLQLDIKKNLIIIGYMYIVILFSYFINKRFFEFSYIDYIYKLILLVIGIFIGYKFNLLHFEKIIQRIKRK